MKEDIYVQHRIKIMEEDNLLRWPKTEPDFKVLGFMRSHVIEPPLSLLGVSTELMRLVVTTVPSSPGEGGYKCVYALVNKDRSCVRVGSGVLERFHIHVSAYLVHITPDFYYPHLLKNQKKNRGFWPLNKELFDMIHNNGGQIDYVILADRLSEYQAREGEKAVRKLNRRFLG